ncbi:MAG: ABC transporter permease subunit, partial [Candidatus Rokubacteria bacterium]|nr:ABC transporter permease subunit [Candidatus Rokubacteria bacterium]
SDRRAIGTAGATGVGPATFINNMEDPWGMTLIAGYAMVKQRHMFQYGTTEEQFANISVVTRRHAMRNALIPPVTVAGLEFGRLFGGVIAVETIFAWPGAGKALVDAIATRDYPMVQGIVLALALLFALLNLAVDLLNGVIDPRARHA